MGSPNPLLCYEKILFESGWGYHFRTGHDVGMYGEDSLELRGNNSSQGCFDSSATGGLAQDDSNQRK